MNSIKTNHIVRGLSLITSCGCNLNCEYCWIAQSVNENSHKMQLENIKALQDGTFIKNVRDVLYRMNQSPLNIESIAFWGQEPTLTLNHITDHFEEWYDLFPNWQHCGFSTNTVAHLDRIIDFFEKVDATVDKRFDFQIQFSYDGDYATDNLRGVSSSLIHDNLVKFFERLNKTYFKHIRVNLNFHAVFSMEILSKLSTSVDEIIKYNDHLQKWGIEFYHLNQNKRVTLAPKVDVALENPVNASTLQGIQLHNIMQLMSRLDSYTIFQENIKQLNSSDMRLETFADELLRLFDQIFMGLEIMLRERFPQFPTLNHLLEAMGEDRFLKYEAFHEMNSMIYCGNGVGEFKIRYDGMLVNCQNHMFETDPQYIKDDGSVKASVKKSLAEKHYFINPLTATDEEINQYLYLFETGKEFCLEFMTKNVITLMEFMVSTGQIDSVYLEPLYLIKTALLVSLANCCSYNNQMMTGSLYLRHGGWIRLLCNGVMEDCVNYFNASHGGVI